MVADAAPGTALVGDGGAGPAGGAGPIPAGGRDLAAVAGFGTEVAAPRPARAPHLPGLVPDWFEPLVLLGIGIGLIAGVSLLRARQRRRQGWGMLPDRSWPGDGLWQ
jgi:hypothetical protein